MPHHRRSSMDRPRPVLPDTLAVHRGAGAFPLWLAPVQVALLLVAETEALRAYADSVVAQLQAAGVRVEVKSGGPPATTYDSIALSAAHLQGCCAVRLSWGSHPAFHAAAASQLLLAAAALRPGPPIAHGESGSCSLWWHHADCEGLLTAGERMPKLIRAAQTDKVPVTCVIGEKEAELGTLAVRGSCAVAHVSFMPCTSCRRIGIEHLPSHTAFRGCKHGLASTGGPPACSPHHSETAHALLWCSTHIACSTCLSDLEGAFVPCCGFLTCRCGCMEAPTWGSCRLGRWWPGCRLRCRGTVSLTPRRPPARTATGPRPAGRAAGLTRSRCDPWVPLLIKYHEVDRIAIHLFF